MSLTEPNEQLVSVFWAVSRKKVKWTSLEALVGQTRQGNIQPPAVQLSDDADEATALAHQLASTQSLVLEDEQPHDEDLDGEVTVPQVGDLMIVCDGAGVPIALAQTAAVEVNGKIISERIISLYPPRG